ncbi:MAG: polyprenyl synthetase family protein [Rickettsiales bacterium]|nr:polyprenyl synthetase family protein [Rickettsiales bacterium]
MLSKSLPESLLICAILTQKTMFDLLPDNFSESRIVEAMRYSALSEGKKIRPFLLLICAELFGTPAISVLNAAAAIEFIHVYSLIHDDLPAMDNDDLRRGQLTCHKRFNEATAILAGDALLTYAFEILSDSATHKDPMIRCELIKILSRAAGFHGMVGGQMMDLENLNNKISKEQMANLHRLKTGELFMASCEMGAVLGHATVEEKQALRYYAHDIGLAFQIRDDILDHKGIYFGKVEIDEIHQKRIKENTSIVDIVGLESAKQQLSMLKEQAISHLKIFGDKAKVLQELAEFIVAREK